VHYGLIARRRLKGTIGAWKPFCCCLSAWWPGKHTNMNRIFNNILASVFVVLWVVLSLFDPGERWTIVLLVLAGVCWMLGVMCSFRR
jgi:hypothetical protein